KEQYDMSPEEYEVACNFLYDAAGYGTVIRSVEAPFIRRVALLRSRGEKPPGSELYKDMRDRLLELCGTPTKQNSIGSRGTLDGDGIIFVSDVGDIYPGGFLPIKLGNVRKDDIVAVYRENEILKNIRNRKFDGSCGKCEFSVNCGGSRARSYAYSGNALGTDYACVYAKTG
ncbi:MAG: radical SAM/SPASM domain-containing protein, partial [Candidatus Marsarchaeota archaeon]|nr:radical SAM/SPASM domain-containing protein [Candidatus Marsarchaeota archaeon]